MYHMRKNTDPDPFDGLPNTDGGYDDPMPCDNIPCGR
jgi:hypothetical protein